MGTGWNWLVPQVVDAAISESVFNMLEGCVPEFTEQGYDRPPSGSTISGGLAQACRSQVTHLAFTCQPHGCLWLARVRAIILLPSL